MESMISIRDLHKRFGPVHAVRGVNLEVPAGEVFCFLGPNGAGKTTTIKILTGLMRPTSGSAVVGGFDMQKDPLSAKKLMGYIPDMPYLYDRLTAAEFFAFIGDLYGVPRPVVQNRRGELFDLLGVVEYADALVRDLSHGMRQRLIYAATFLHEPKVLFVDEPLIGLDPYTIRLIKDLLVQYARAGMTIFLTTHILALAEDVGHRIGIIESGSLVAVGSLSELLEMSGTENLEDAFLKLTRVGARGTPGGADVPKTS